MFLCILYKNRYNISPIITDLWATKVKETPVDALGYTVKIQESNTATSFFKPKI